MKQTTLNVIVFLISLWCCSSLVLATGKTNVNEVNDLFDRHIENKSELMRDLQEQQSGTVTQIQSGEGLQHIEGIGEAESTAKELESIREVDLESSGRQKRASEEYSFYDKNELEPDYSKSGNIAHKQDCDEIVSQTGLSMKKLGSDFQTKLSAVGINCQKDKADKDLIVKFDGRGLKTLKELTEQNAKESIFLEEIAITYKFEHINIKGLYRLTFNFSNALKNKQGYEGIFKSEPFLIQNHQIKSLTNIDILKRDLNKEIERLKLEKFKQFNIIT